jgi:hypothetical protein
LGQESREKRTHLSLFSASEASSIITFIGLPFILL